MLIQGVGSGNLAIGESGLIQHFASLSAQVGDITGVNTNALGAMTVRHQYLIKHLNRIGNTGF